MYFWIILATFYIIYASSQLFWQSIRQSWSQAIWFLDFRRGFSDSTQIWRIFFKRFSSSGDYSQPIFITILDCFIFMISNYFTYNQLIYTILFQQYPLIKYQSHKFFAQQMIHIRYAINSLVLLLHYTYYKKIYMEMMNQQELPAQFKLQMLLQLQIDEQAAQAAIQNNPHAGIEELMTWAVDQYPTLKKKQANRIIQAPTINQMSMFEGAFNNFGYNPGTVSQVSKFPSLTEQETKEKLLGLLTQARQIRQQRMGEEKILRKKYLDELGQTQESMAIKFKQWQAQEQIRQAKQKIQREERQRKQRIAQRKRKKQRDISKFIYTLAQALRRFWGKYPKAERDARVEMNEKFKEQQRKEREENPEKFKEQIEREKQLSEQLRRYMDEDEEEGPVKVPEKIPEQMPADIPANRQDNKQDNLQNDAPNIKPPFRPLHQTPGMQEEPKEVDLKELTEEEQFQFEELISECKKLEIYKIANPDTAKGLLQTLIKVLDKIVGNFDDKKFRRLKKSNPTLKEKVFKYPDSGNFMNWLGFTEEGEEYFMDLDMKDERQLKKMTYILKQYRKNMS